MADARVQRASPPTERPDHPFANSSNLVVVIPDRIDVEEEARLYEELCDVSGL